MLKATFNLKGRMYVKKIIVFSLISLLVLTAACKNDISLDSLNDTELSTLELNSIEVQGITKSSKDSTVDFNNSENIDNYIYRRNFVKESNWIYYVLNESLRKCKPDLTEDTLLMEGVNTFYIQNMTLYFDIYRTNNKMEIYRANLNNNDDFKAEKIAEFNEPLGNYILFRDNIYYENSGNLVKHSINENVEQIIIDDNISGFSVIDHYIYYNTYDSNSVWRYDIESDKSEIFIQFQKQDNFAPKVYFRNRMIIIQTYVNSFTYAAIDDKVLKKFSFDISEYERGWVTFHFVDEENLYFSVSEHYDVSNPLTNPRNIFEVKMGTEQIKFVAEMIGDNIGYLIDGYLYSFDEDNNINKEKLNN